MHNSTHTFRMGNTYCCQHTHIVFSTKNRVPLISHDLSPRLYAYIGGVVRNRNCSLLSAGGVEDHVHLLIDVHQSVALSDLVRDIKSNASRWFHEDMLLDAFAWQSGYAAFSVSASNIEAVRGYIDRQHEHHKSQSFEDELIAFLERHGISYDLKFLLD